MTDPVIVDVYAEDLNGKPDWSKLVSAGPPWSGAIVKATEGLAYAPAWFGVQWQAIQSAAGPKLGDTFFRGCYHYLHMALDGAAQADYFLAAVQRAGGFRLGDLPPIVDVESANNGACTAPQVIECVSDFAARLKAKGCPEVILYGGSLMYDLGIVDRMGCDWLWLPRYTATLPANIYERIGWGLPVMWQYTDGKTSLLEGYPTTSPMGEVDMSAVIANGGGDAAIAWMRGVRT